MYTLISEPGWRPDWFRDTFGKIHCENYRLFSATFKNPYWQKMLKFTSQILKNFITIVFTLFTTFTLRGQESCFTKDFLWKYLTLKGRCRNHITSSFSRMVSPSHLILTEHVTISLLPIKFWLSSWSSASISTNQQMTIFA